MAIKDTVKKMHHLLSTISKDLAKAEKGNKAASQRVRTGSIKLEKLAKVYRKESVAAEKGKKGVKKVKAKKTKKTMKKPVKKVKKAVKRPAKKVKRRR